ncbi:MAG: flagellar assembly protein FliX [Alphaproteobacteria bacterium]
MVKSQTGHFADPRLKKILGEIEISAAIELAELRRMS